MKTFSKTIVVENKTILERIFVPNGEFKVENAPKALLLQASEDKMVFQKVLHIIANAKKTICFQSFLVQDTAIIDALIAATKRDVKVFVTTCADARLKPEMYKEEEPDFIKNDYIKMLTTKFRFNFVHRSAANLHAKFIVIDGNTDNSKGMLFTNNFTENGFLKNPELAIELNATQANELFKLFVYTFWERTTDEQNTSDNFDIVKAAKKFELPTCKEILHTWDRSLKNTIHKAIENAKTEICLSAFSLDMSFDLVKMILEKQKKGVKIKIFTRLNERYLNENVKILLENGAEVFCHPTTHAKFLMTDSKQSFLFTANYDANSFENSFNIGLVLSSEQTGFLNKIIAEWSIKMPYQWLKSESILNIKDYSMFENGRLKPNSVATAREEKEHIDTKKTSDLLDFFAKNRKIQGANLQRSTITLNANISLFKGELNDSKTYKVEKKDNFMLVTEYTTVVIKNKDKNSKTQETETKEKNKFIILEGNFQLDTVHILEEYRSSDIFAI